MKNINKNDQCNNLIELNMYEKQNVNNIFKDESNDDEQIKSQNIMSLFRCEELNYIQGGND